MNTEIEYRISEEHARSILGPGEGSPINGRLRVVKLDADDPRLLALARLYSRHQGKGFYGWRIRRQYSKTEILDATVHLFQIKTGILPTGEECGTTYSDSDVCPLCGAGRVQGSPLRLRLTNAPKRSEMAQTWGGEIIVSDRVVKLLIKAKATGWGLGTVQRPRKGEEEPFTLSETRSGKRLLRAAARAGILYPSPEFYVWINAPDQYDAFLEALKEHQSRKLAGRRLVGGTSPDWYQLFVTSKPLQLSRATRFGCGPFDEDTEGRYRCPLGLRDHVVGLNLLSQVSVQGVRREAADLARSSGLVGRRKGLFNPRPLLFISARLLNLLLEHGVKGWTSEPADIAQ